MKIALMVGVSGLALAIGAGGPGARAADECGVAAPGGTATCTPAGNSFPDGIEYQVDDLTIVVQDGVVIDTTGAAGEPGGVVSGGAGDYGTLVIKAGTSGGSGITITTDDAAADGIHAETELGGITITSFGTIATSGDDAQGIYGRSKNFYALTISSTGAVTTSGANASAIEAQASKYDAVTVTSIGSLATSGNFSDAIYATGGKITVSSNGAISTKGDGADGVAAIGTGYDAVTITATGTIVTEGASAIGIRGSNYAGDVKIAISGSIFSVGYGIYASTDYYGDIVIESEADITIAGATATGIHARSKDGNITIESAGTITATQLGSDGIVAYSGGGIGPGGAVNITSVGDISTSGLVAWGIGGTSLTGTVTITSDGNISTAGEAAIAIRAAGGGLVQVDSTGKLTTLGDQAEAVLAVSDSGDVSVASTGALFTAGADSSAIYARAYTGNVTVTASGDISTEGGSSSAVYAKANGAVTISTTSDLSTEGSGAFGIFGYAKTGAIEITSAGDIATAGTGSSAISATAQAGGITIETSGDLETAGTSANAILAYAKDGAVTVTSVGDVTTGGTSAVGILAIAPDGDVKIESTGAIATLGTSAHAMSATATAGAVTITSKGDIATEGSSATALQATATTGEIKIESTGAIATLGNNASGISALTDGTITIMSQGAIATEGAGARGIIATGDAGDVTITASGSIATKSDSASAIAALTEEGAVKITSDANLSAVGLNSDGINAFSSDGGVTIIATGNISTQGAEAQGILAVGEDSVSITATGATIRTSGEEGHAIQAHGDVGSVSVTAGTAIATGENATGISAVTIGPAGAAQVSIAGDVAGGWGTLGRGVNIDANFASVLTLQSGASVGALSDVAVQDGDETLSLINQGTITGIVRLGSGADAFSNQSSNSWNLRNFADTDGDGVRDTEGVAIADFGAGTDSFTNTGTLSLASVVGASAFDTTGQIAHPGGGNAETTQERIEQGFLTNLESFAHSGLITLQDGAAGDLLVITDQADGGTAGNNVFTSNGGRLALDVVLDDGSSQQSDVLVLDKAVTGSGATTLLISNAGGAGGATEGDGILVVNVRTGSDADAFELGSQLIAGAYRYDLYFQNAAKTDENWYLRSSFFEGALDYPSISSGALETWYADLGSLHERLGERRRQVEDGQTAALPSATDVADTSAVRVNDAGQGGWFRVVGADMDIEQDGAADFDLNTVRAEAGFDVGFDNLLSDDWLVLGAFAGYGWASLGFDRDADADFDIATVGAYATYFRGPYYLDALVKFDWLDGNYRSELVADDGEIELPVFGLSLETGYRFDLTQGGLYLQPQAQLSYAHVGDDSFADDTGAEIALEDADSLRGRIGARLGQELWSDSGGAKGNFYFEASASQEFLGETEANVTGLAIEQELPETRFEVGGGFDIALPKDGVTLTLDADYIFGEEVDGVAATGGLRISW